MTAQSNHPLMAGHPKSTMMAQPNHPLLMAQPNHPLMTGVKRNPFKLPRPQTRANEDNSAAPAHMRAASLTDPEKFFLRALLLDDIIASPDNTKKETAPAPIVPKPPVDVDATPKVSHVTSMNCIDKHNYLKPPPIPNRHGHHRRISSGAHSMPGDLHHRPIPPVSKAHPPLKPKVLNENILFSVPQRGVPEENAASQRRFGRPAKKLLWLWHAHEDGATSALLKRARSGSFHPGDMAAASSKDTPCLSRNNSRASCASFDNPHDGEQWTLDPSEGSTSIKSDVEVRPNIDSSEGAHDDISWNESAGGEQHYNAWEVLNDEYATDFGFDYQENKETIQATLNDQDDFNGHVFRILGTSADDKAAQPHVLSPPLMDSLLNFLPDSVSMENYWLKFSLVRDGASLYTLKQYVKASPLTLMAIETTKGEVFGAFTSHLWRNHPTFYGSGPAVLWRMRHNRQTPCHSLFEQAQMESEIDVFAFSGLNDFVQVCQEHRICIGGGKLVPDIDESGNEVVDEHTLRVETLEDGQNFGFGIAINEDLSQGTTSPSGTFRNPCLINNMSKGEVFEIANLEMWTFTPMIDVQAAERMEMTRFFVEQSIRSLQTTATKTALEDINNNQFASQEELQQHFYRRVGQERSEKFRSHESFEYRALVNPTSARNML